MQVIPVIDLMNAQVVRGVGGRRDQYRPIQSLLAADAKPNTVARALAAAGFRETYVADLDAIRGAAPAWSIYEELMRCGLELWVDGGLSTLGQAREMLGFHSRAQPLWAIVAGLESLDGPEALSAICAAVGHERLIFSLDLKLGVPLIGSPAWQGLTAQQIAAIALRAGVRRMIVLDLACVGMGHGVGTERLCRDLRCLDAGLQITAGGGVRGLSDLRSLQRSGCDAALVASALHDGRLTPRECTDLR
ncbi:MAG: hisA/hisF family protein [Planctomycetia bacterium]|nr:hisA/hisF family protein [Planctomycetia bacterium]